MELLLLLTAIFASLTGAGGDRGGVVQQMQGVAVVRSAQVAQAAVQPARCAMPAVAVQALRPELKAWARLAAAPLRSFTQVFGRRLE